MVDVAIIIPLYKGERYIDRLIQMLNEAICYLHSVDKCELQVVFVNDGAINPELERKTHQLDDVSVNYIQNETNIGIHGARIKGLKQSESQFVIFLDQDDFVKKEWLLSQYASIKKQDADIVVCNGTNGRFHKLWNYEQMEKWVNNLEYYLSYRNPIISPGTTIIRRSAIPLLWTLDCLKKNGADDFFLWVHCLKNRCKFSLNDRILFMHSLNEWNTSSDYRLMAESIHEFSDILFRNAVIDSGEKEKLDEYSNRLVNRYLLGHANEKKKLLLLNMCERWCDEQKIADFFGRIGAKQVAIYGAGEIGVLIHKMLTRSGIEVQYYIDRQAYDYYEEIPVLLLEEELPIVDAIVVSIIIDEETTCGKLQEKGFNNILTVNDLCSNV